MKKNRILATVLIVALLASFGFGAFAVGAAASEDDARGTAGIGFYRPTNPPPGAITVTYHSNWPSAGGEAPAAYSVNTATSLVSGTANFTSPSGYNQRGWTFNPDGTGGVFDPLTTRVTASIHVYARWAREVETLPPPTERERERERERPPITTPPPGGGTTTPPGPDAGGTTPPAPGDPTPPVTPVAVAETTPPAPFSIIPNFSWANGTQAPLVEIGDTQVPLVAFEGVAAWALVNLILSAIGVVAAIVTTIRYLRRKKKVKTEEEEASFYPVMAEQAANIQAVAQVQTIEEDIEEEKSEAQKRKRRTWLIAADLLAVLAVILFFITQDIYTPMVLFDYWTIVHAVMIVLEVIAIRAIFSRKKKNDKGEKGEPAEVQAVPV